MPLQLPVSSILLRQPLGSTSQPALQVSQRSVYFLTVLWSLLIVCQWRIETFGKGGNLICFPGSHIYLFVGVGTKVARLDGGDHGRIHPPGSATVVC